MNSERTGLERRSAWHAALADTARLRIVDLLALGDRSPGELRNELGIASNLLAHHLGVLEAEGIIARTRSEGDRRRSYVRLADLTAASDSLGAVLRAERVVFVCTGNSARSPLAAAIWGSLSVTPATSAGTIPAERTSKAAVATATRHRLDIAGHTPRPLADVRRDGDLVVTVCDRAHEALGTASALHWSVPNPGLIGGQAAYEAAFAELDRRVHALASRVAA